MIYRFGQCELNRAAYSLTRSGETLHLPPRCFDLLVYLIEHRGQVVTYDEVLDAVWASEPAAPSAVHWAVSKIRSVLAQPRGAQEPVETIPRRGYRFAGELREEPARPASRSSTSTAERGASEETAELIGREPALAALRRAVEAARTGSGGLHLLVGETGMGKSRCILEFARRLASEGLVWSGVCGRGESTGPLAPWLQILRVCAEDASVARPLRREAEALAAEIQAPAGEDPGGSPAAARSLLDRVRGLLLDAAKDHVHVVVLDDLHDADALSLDLLLRLLPHLAQSRLMIVGAVQHAVGGEASKSQALRDIQGWAQRIWLEPWSRDQVAQLLRRSRPGAASEALANLVWQRSGGNPLLVEDLSRLNLVRERDLAESAEVRAVRSGRPLPQTTRELMRERMRGLPQTTVAALAAASVIGRSFHLALLRRVTEQSEASLLSAIDTALQLGIVERDERATAFVFRHDLLRDAIYGDLPGAERSRLHGLVGAALEDSALGPASSSVLAWHFYCAAPLGYGEKAVHHASRAASRAKEIAARVDEVRYREWALEAQAFCPTLDVEARCELRMALGAARLELGDEQSGRREIVRAIEIAEAQGLPRILARAGCALRRSTLLSAVPDAVALRALEEARYRLPETEPALRSRVASHLAWMPPYVHRPEDQQALLAEAFALAEASGSPIAMLDARRAHCQAATSPSHADVLIARAAELEKQAEWTGSATIHLEGQLLRHLGQLQLGRLSEAFETLRVAIPRLDDPAARESAWMARHLDARAAFYAGDLAEVTRRYENLRPRRRTRRSELAEFHWLAGMTLVHLERGTAGEFGPHFADTAQLWQQRSAALCAMSLRMRLTAGRRDEARAELDLMPIARLRQRPLRAGQLGVLCHLAVAASELGDRFRCQVLYDELTPYAHLHGLDLLWFSLGPVSYFLGVLAATLGEPDVARQHFEAALRESSASGHRPQLAWTRFQLGRLLATGAVTEDRDAGHRLLREASTEAQAMGMSVLGAAVARATAAPAPRPAHEI